MGIGSVAVSGVGNRTSRWLDSLVRFANRYRKAWPAVGVVVATVVAYHFTLASFFDFLSRDTPLAYLPLLPFFCIGIAVVTAKRYALAPPIKDRQIDFLIGVPLIIVALALITIAPAIASAYYWNDRADVVSLTLFAAGATVIAYGITSAWRLRASFFFLLLMWPALYLHLLNSLVLKFADWTNAALAFIVVHLPLGATLGGPQTVVVNPQHMAPVAIQISSACSGANSVIGFALIGGAILTTMRGGRGRKLLWWIIGMVLCFVFNLLRLLSIIALSAMGHSTFALGGYHAVIGLILFAVAVVVMLYALPLLGLHPKEAIQDRARALTKTVSAQASSLLTTDLSTSSSRTEMAQTPTLISGPARAPRKPGLRRKRIALGLVGVFTAIVALADNGLQPYAAFEDGTGAPTVHVFSTQSGPPGWQIIETNTYPWVTQYYGDNATWNRYQITRLGSTGVAYADVVLTDDKGSLDAYNVQNCFLFHNYDIRTAERVNLGSGVTAILLNYSDPSTNQRWATVSWAWPIAYRGTTYYERINLTSSPYAGTAQAPGVAQPSTGPQQLLLDLLNGVSGARNDPKAGPLYHNVDVNLESEAYGLVGHAVKLAG